MSYTDKKLKSNRKTNKSHSASSLSTPNREFYKNASSRTTPFPTPELEFGTWRYDDYANADGEHEVAQLRLLDPFTITPTEDLVEHNVEGRRYDAERYASWISEGKIPPPIDVMETFSGKLQLPGDGHRRLYAYKLLNIPIPAWVYPFHNSKPLTLEEGLRIGLIAKGD